MANKDYKPITLMFSPGVPRKNLMWDTWLYYESGTYYLYYLGGRFVEWDCHCLAVSNDGVHWKDLGPVIADKPENCEWVGTGGTWKSPDFESNRMFISNYSICLKGTQHQHQHIRFATSNDLVNWKLVKDYRFCQDDRWYLPDKRWDTINVLPVEEAGEQGSKEKGYYGFWTASVDKTKSDGHFGFGFSEDGLHWQALEPLKLEGGETIAGEHKYEIAGVARIDKWYYIIYDEGNVVMSENIKGPYRPAPRNVLITGGTTCFPRLSMNHPGCYLLTFYFCKGPVMLSPLVCVQQTEDGALFAKWWPQNEKLKHEEIKLELKNENHEGIKLLKQQIDSEKGAIIEGRIKRPAEKSASGDGTGSEIAGLYFYSAGDLPNVRFLIGNGKTTWEEIDCLGQIVKQSVTDRHLDWPEEVSFRIAIKNDCIQLYIEDYLMENRRILSDGRVGFIGEICDTKAWHTDCNCCKLSEIKHAELITNHTQHKDL